MVKIVRAMNVESQKMLDGVTMRMVLGPDEGAPRFNMRIFEVQPGASTPYHSHWWEHEVYIISGKGAVLDEKGEHSLEPGNAVLVPGGEKHHFINTGNEVLRFMCLVPQEWLESYSGDADSVGCMG
jgi:quercetin dioxygenase-like cupin family protein